MEFPRIAFHRIQMPFTFVPNNQPHHLPYYRSSSATTRNKLNSCLISRPQSPMQGSWDVLPRLIDKLSNPFLPSDPNSHHAQTPSPPNPKSLKQITTLSTRGFVAVALLKRHRGARSPGTGDRSWKAVMSIMPIRHFYYSEILQILLRGGRRESMVGGLQRRCKVRKKWYPCPRWCHLH